MYVFISLLDVEFSEFVDAISTSGGSRLGHRASGTRSKSPNLNENGQNPHFS